MREQHPETETVKSSEARQQWSRLLNKVFRGESRIIVEKSGIPVAALISVEDLKQLTQLEQEQRERFKVLDEIGEVFKDVPPEEIEQEIERIINEVRQTNRLQEQPVSESP